MFANRREDRRIGRPTSHWKFAIACAWVLALGPLAAASATAVPPHQQCGFDPALIAAFAEASNQSRRQAGVPDWTQQDLERTFNEQWDTYARSMSRQDWDEALKDRKRKDPGGIHWEDAQKHPLLQAGLVIDKARIDVFIARARCEGLIDGKSSAPPASAKLPASAPTQVPGSAEEQRAALEALQRVINDTSELEAAKASAERVLAETTAELEREVEATKDCGWFPEHCKPEKPKGKPKPPSLQTEDNVGTRCARLTLEDFRVDEHGNASYEFVLANRCGTMQLVNVQVAEDANDPAPGTPSGLAWMGSHPDWSGEAPGGLGFEPVIATYWHYLMPPRSEHRGNRVAATPGQKLHAWLASCDAYADGYYQVLFQASPYLNQDNRVACVKNRPGAPR